MSEQFIEHNYDGLTGEVTLIPYTAEQIAVVMLEREAIEKIETDKIVGATQAATDKTVATAKLAALGLTTDDLKALGLGTN